MQLPMESSPADTTAAIIILCLLFFYAYYYLAHADFLKNFIAKKSSQQQQKLLLFSVRKITGFIFLGVLPGVLYYVFVNPEFLQFGISVKAMKENISLLLILFVIIVTILFVVQSANPERSSLQIDLKEWSLSLFLLNSLGWIIYLAGYEFLFRGILLFECNQSFGFWPAIAINVAIYSAIHMVNGKDQAIGALIFGTLACYFTLTRGTILIPFFMHVSLSVMSDFFSIKLNRNLCFVNRKNK